MYTVYYIHKNGRREQIAYVKDLDLAMKSYDEWANNEGIIGVVLYSDSNHVKSDHTINHPEYKQK